MNETTKTPAEREGEIRTKIARLRLELPAAQRAVENVSDDLDAAERVRDDIKDRIARLESELSALAPDAPWTPRVGDRVVMTGSIGCSDVSINALGQHMMFVQIDNSEGYGYFVPVSALRPAPCEDAGEVAGYVRTVNILGNDVKVFQWDTIVPEGEPANLRPVYYHPSPASGAVDAEEPEPEYFCTTEQFKDIFGDLDDQPEAVDAEPVGWMAVNKETNEPCVQNPPVRAMDVFPTKRDCEAYMSHRWHKAVPVYDHPAPASGKLAAPDAFWSKQMELVHGICVKVYTAKGDYIGIGLNDIDGFCASLRATATPRKEEE